MSNRVLIVDDNQKFLAMLQEFLSEYEGIEVVGAAASAQEALGLIDDTRPQVLIIDLWMPDMSGLELTHFVKSRWPRLTTVVLTLFDSPHHRKAAFDAGADAFVGKARMDSELVPAIQYAVAKAV